MGMAEKNELLTAKITIFLTAGDFAHHQRVCYMQKSSGLADEVKMTSLS